MQQLTVRSSGFKSQGEIPASYSCEGRSVSPPISWSGVPGEARSVAVIVDDPDAPRGTFTHWVLYNLPPDASELPEGVSANELPEGTDVGENSAGDAAYYPMCPPSGRHRYYFKVYALDTAIDNAEHLSAKRLEQEMQGHILAQGELMGTYAKHGR